MTDPIPDPVEAEILRQTAAGGIDRSISPNDVARALMAGAGPDAWRTRLGDVRRAAIRLARQGTIEILRKGKPVAPDAARGVIRLRGATMALPD